MSSITDEQEKFLKEFSCERLKSNALNISQIDYFKNEKGKLIVDYFKQNAWDEDNDGETAYYIIKHHNKILLCFSIKCGALFDPLLDKNSEIKSRYYMQKEKIKNYLEIDKCREINDNIHRVAATHSGIELKHFCINEEVKQKIPWNIRNHTLGEVLFWKFLVPIILDLQNRVGCKYLFLFAADLTDDQSLVNYYHTSLNFDQPNDIGTSKPVYDFSCIFMCQSINILKEKYDVYFNEFNVNEEEFI